MSPKRHTNTLAQLRTKRGLSLQDAGRLIGATAHDISNYEGGIGHPNLTRVVALSVVYAKDPRKPVPLERMFPSLFAQARAKIAQQHKARASSQQQKHYEPKPSTDTILSLHAGRPCVIGMAVFEAAHTHEDTRLDLRKQARAFQVRVQREG